MNDLFFHGPDISAKSQNAIRESRARLQAGVKIYTGAAARRIGKECGYLPPQRVTRKERHDYFNHWEKAMRNT